MLREAIKGLLFMLACTMLTCLASIMALFTIGVQNGSDLQMLMQVQALSVPLGIIVIAWAVVAVGDGTITERLRKLYSATPQWLIFSAGMLNLLVASGEISLITVFFASDQEILWTDHIALVSMIVSSLAFCLLYGHSQRLSGRKTALSGRWGP